MQNNEAHSQPEEREATGINGSKSLVPVAGSTSNDLVEKVTLLKAVLTAKLNEAVVILNNINALDFDSEFLIHKNFNVLTKKADWVLAQVRVFKEIA